MQQRSFRVAVALACLALAIACSKEAPAPSGPPANAKRVDTATAGKVSGRVVLDGPAPPNAAIKMEADPVCLRAHPDGTTLENIIVDNGGLENAFVYVKDGLDGYGFDTPVEPVRIDQQGCRYRPHVIGVRAGQPIEFTTSDATLHNVHALAKTNREFNFGLELPGQKQTRKFNQPEVLVTLKCDVHPWMRAYAGVVAHPYFAVTANGGAFDLKDLPAGTYTIEAVHEKLGSQTQRITIGEKESKEVTFTFKASAASTN